jgi:alpha-tubulin suppressor-like RCC1 family protein
MSTLDLGKIKQLWRGTWNTSSSYLPNDIVAYNGAIWICTQAHGTGSSTEFSPGKRDRTNYLPKTVDTQEINTYNITVSTVSSNNYFFIDGRQTPNLTLYANVHYKFFQKDSSNVSHRFALSTTPDGIYGSGGVELSSNNAGYTYQYSGTPGIDGSLDVVLSSGFVGSLYYYSANDTGFGGASLSTKPVLTVSPAWRGYQYWDQLTTGYQFIGTWSSGTQYYYNNIVEYQGATYLALADNINIFPGSPNIGTGTGTNTVTAPWMLLVNGDRRSEHNSIGWLMNKGPIGWPYPNGNQGQGEHYQAMKWISRSGRVYNHGCGYQYNHGVSNSQSGNGGTGGSTGAAFTHPQEVTFNHIDWWQSRDNGGPGRLVTPDGMPPKCIQIEAGINWAHYLFNNGEVWGNGLNTQGYLGTGDTISSGLPRRVQGLNDTRIVKISAPYGIQATDNHHVLALDEYGYVWAWGQNDVGQCGVGSNTNTANNTATYLATAQRLPRIFFNNERVVDILAMGTTGSGCSYARTAQGNIYAWGYNGVSQLGTGDTTTRYRPVQMSTASWTPSANNGIQKWQAAGVGSYASFMILDGNGFLWQTGYDNYGAAGNSATASSRTTLTKSSAGAGVAGSINNFWLVWSGESTGYYLNFIKTVTGATYVCGAGSNPSGGTTGNNVYGYGTVSQQPATSILVTNGVNPLSGTIGSSVGLVNITDIYMHVDVAGTNRTITWLTASGKVFSQGYNNFGELGNPGIASGSGGTNPVDETGSTYSPVVTYAFPGTKPIQIIPAGGGTSNGSAINIQHGMFALTDIGQVYGWGCTYGSNNQSPGLDGSFIGYSPTANGTATGTGRGVFTPVCIQYAR